MSTSYDNVINFQSNLNYTVNTNDLDKVITALKNIQSLATSGNPMLKYWSSQENMIKAVQNAYDKYRYSLRSDDAISLVNSANALKSAFSDYDFANIDKGFNKIFRSAQEASSGLAGVFSKSQFDDVFMQIDDSIKILEADYEGLTSRFRNARNFTETIFNSSKAEALQQELDKTVQDLVEVQNEASETRIELEKLQQTDLGRTQEEITNLRGEIDRLQTQKVREFTKALEGATALSFDQAFSLRNGNHIDVIDSVTGEVNSYLEFINEAVDRLRNDPNYSVAEALTQTKQAFTSMFSGSSGEIDTSGMVELNGVIDRLNEAISRMGTTAGSGGAEQLQSIFNSLSAGASESAPGSLQEWITFFNELKGLDIENKIVPIQRLVNTMQTDVSVNTNSLLKVGQGLHLMTQDLDVSKLAVLKGISFEGLKNLKISSTLKHLTEQLVPFSNTVNMDNLERLSKLNFSNLSKEGGLNINSGALKGLANIANQSELTSITSSLQQMAASVEELYNRISQSSKKAEGDLVGTNSTVASNIAKSTREIKELKAEFESRGISDDRIDETIASLAKLRESYKETELTHDEYNKTMSNVKLNIKDLAEVAKSAAKAEKEAAKEAEAAAKQAEKEQEKNAKLREDPEKFDEYMTKFNTLEANIRKHLNDWSKAKYGATSESYKNLEQTADAVREVTASLKDMTAVEADEALDRNSNSAKRFSNEIKIANNNTKSFGDRIALAIKNYAAFFTGMSAVMRIVQYGRQAVNAITEIDYSMNQLKIVTRESDQALSSYADSIVKIADKTAGSVTDLVDATTTYARLGYSLNESTILADLTQMLQNVGDIEASDAQNAITAIIKAFDIDVNDMEGVLDRMVEVGNNFPISVSQLAEGLNNASSILAVATNYQDDAIASFEKSAAMLTAANVTVNMCRAA